MLKLIPTQKGKDRPSGNSKVGKFILVYTTTGASLNIEFVYSKR